MRFGLAREPHAGTEVRFEHPQVIVVHRVRDFRLGRENLHGLALGSDDLVLGILERSPITDGLLVPPVHDEPELKGTVPRYEVPLDDELVIGVHTIDGDHARVVLRDHRAAEVEFEVHGGRILPGAGHMGLESWPWQCCGYASGYSSKYTAVILLIINRLYRPIRFQPGEPLEGFTPSQ